MMIQTNLHKRIGIICLSAMMAGGMLCPLKAMAQSASDAWTVTATAFKLVGEKEVNNVKVNWMKRTDADTYKVYRDGKLIGEVIGSTYDDYALPVNATYTYHVEAWKGNQKVADALPQDAATFVPESEGRVYDNKSGKYLTKVRGEKPGGMKIGNLYYSYRMERVGEGSAKQWKMTESYSATGMKGSWSEPRELASYPGTQKFEGNSFRYNAKTGKVVFTSHYEDADGYSAGKIFLAEITPKGKLVVGTAGRPLGCDSRDQSVFVDEDGTAYLLSATNTNQDINIYQLDATWTRPVKLVNTVFKNQHRETPAIVKKDGVYYFFSSKASGWYPSQTMYASTTDLGGEWTPLREIGNNTTFDAQANNISRQAGERATYGLWSYHWGAQRKHKTPDGNFPRMSVVAFNHGYASMDFYRYVEFHDKYGMIPVQSGRNLTLGKPVTSIVDSKAAPAACITDGDALASSPYFQGWSCPYSLIIDMEQEARISEINMATRLVNGSETAYKYLIEGSTDGKTYTTLVDGLDNWQLGFLILPVDDASAYRYLRLSVARVKNVHNGTDAEWAEGVYELTAFGEQQ